jgi:tRNA G18 (ribose-2'-O)-methylase SpoU
MEIGSSGPPGTIAVDDPADPRLAVFAKNERGLASRPQRRDDAGDGWFMAEGDLVVERALAAGCEPVCALVDASRPPDVTLRLVDRVPVYAGGERMRAVVTQLGVPLPIVAIFERPTRPSVAELAATSRRLVLVEAVDNPANVGSIVRNAAGLGWDGLVLDGTSADPLARRSLRVSMGHAVAFPHARTRDLRVAIETLTDAGFVVAALTPAADAVDIGALHRPRPERLVVAMGAERSGLSDVVLGAAALRVRIPMARGVDSLNVAAATAIVCHALG